MSFLDWLFPGRVVKREAEAERARRDEAYRNYINTRSRVIETNVTHKQVQVAAPNSVAIQAGRNVSLKATRPIPPAPPAPRRDYAEEARIRARREEEEDSRRRFNDSANDDPVPMSLYGLSTFSASPSPSPAPAPSYSSSYCRGSDDDSSSSRSSYSYGGDSGSSYSSSDSGSSSSSTCD